MLIFIIICIITLHLFLLYEYIRSRIISIKTMGRLGNMLFQFAFIYSLARDNHCSFHIDIDDNTNGVGSLFLTECIVKQSSFSHHYPENSTIINEKREFTHDKYIVDCNTHFIGYFQSVKYFDKYRKELLEILKEPVYVSNVLDNIDIDFNNGMFLHVRLGDYTNLSEYKIPYDYYTKCLDCIPKYIKHIYVFSDDIEQAPNKLPSDVRLEFIHNPLNELETLFAMSRMKYGGICANSTFSWWGSWLNTSPDKIIYMPKIWYRNNTYDDIYPKNCITV